ncbi:putative NADH-dependent flavin oxidoreductase [Aspergillus karnatakaensis]|uniref:NADH:flavin oxidoreductase/NADH oxidase n=1 Tax=Aspergillus karnatakaensis TaxID=1810916 RepID=UPI003CCD239A
MTVSGSTSRPAPSIPVPTPSGTPHPTKSPIPTLFTPLTIRCLTLQNRLVVSPMGTWSAVNGHLTDFHIAHHGAFATRGTALTIIEATSVTANGRTSPQDAGLWTDSQIAPLKRVVDFVHAQGQKIGIQLNHAGRKAGMLAPKVCPGGVPTVAMEQEGGWPGNIWGPCPIRYSDAYVLPRVMSLEDIEGVVKAFADAAGRAVTAGVDLIEVHAAHGYLIHQFLSPLSNTRTDEYGGSFENRTRFLRRIIQTIRDTVPESVVVSVRISATDWMEWSGKPSWTLDQSIELAKLLPALGVDIIDVSSAGLVEEQKIEITRTYQLDLAGAVRRALRESGYELLVAAVGFIKSPGTARDVVQASRLEIDEADGSEKAQKADLAFVGRQFLREAGFVLRCAQELGVEVEWAYQYDMARPRDRS